MIKLILKILLIVLSSLTFLEVSEAFCEVIPKAWVSSTDFLNNSKTDISWHKMTANDNTVEIFNNNKLV